MPGRGLRVPPTPDPLIAVEEGAFLYWTSGANVPHQPHLVKAYVPLSGPMVLVLPDCGVRLETREPVLIDADLLQQVVVAGPRVTLFLDPETAGWRPRQILRAHGVQWMPISRELVEPLYALAPGTMWGKRLLDLLVRVRDRVAHMDPTRDVPELPPAVRDVAAQIVMSGVVDRHAMAGSVGLSAARLTRLFRTHTGITLRRYAQWAKLTRAIAVASRGASLLETTGVGGFSDQAHFTRSARDLLGSVPTGIPFSRCLMRGNFFAGLGDGAEGFVDSLRM